MYLLTNHKNVITHISETLGEQEISKNVLVDGGSFAIPRLHIKEIYEVAEVPDEVVEQKYCYTAEKGFYLNKNYVEPYNANAEIEALKEQITEIQLAMVEQAESEV